MHRDLKPDNVFIDDDGNVRIADFGLAINIGKCDKLVDVDEYSIIKGNNLYRSPEFLNGEAYSQKAEVYSLGLLIWYVFTGKTPFGGAPSHELVKLKNDQNSSMLDVDVKTLKYIEDPGDNEPIKNVLRLASECYAFDPERRCDLEYVMKSIVGYGVSRYTTSISLCSMWKRMCLSAYRDHILLSTLVDFIPPSFDPKKEIARTLRKAVPDSWDLLDMRHFYLMGCWFPNFFSNKRSYNDMKKTVYSEWYCADERQADHRMRSVKEGDCAFVIRPSASYPKLQPFVLCLKQKNDVVQYKIARIIEGEKGSKVYYPRKPADQPGAPKQPGVPQQPDTKKESYVHFGCGLFPDMQFTCIRDLADYLLGDMNKPGSVTVRITVAPKFDPLSAYNV